MPRICSRQPISVPAESPTSAPQCCTRFISVFLSPVGAIPVMITATAGTDGDSGFVFKKFHLNDSSTSPAPLSEAAEGDGLEKEHPRMASSVPFPVPTEMNAVYSERV